MCMLAGKMNIHTITSHTNTDTHIFLIIIKSLCSGCAPSRNKCKRLKTLW